MKDDSELTIKCGHNGTLEIVGAGQGSVVFCMSGHLVWNLQRKLPPFCKNPIFTKTVNSGEEIFIFEKNLRSELRNPGKLLKSVRNKLAQASYLNSVDAEREFNAMYEPTPRQEHRMFQ